MTQRISSTLGLAFVGVLLTAVGGGCGKYGPAEPYPPGYEAPPAQEEPDEEDGQK